LQRTTPEAGEGQQGEEEEEEEEEGHNVTVLSFTNTIWFKTETNQQQGLEQSSAALTPLSL
jgi:hypothetical protein